MMVGWLLLIFSACLMGMSNGIDCSAFQECNPSNRRILFILDGSLSIGQENFDTSMMDYVINTFCGFRNTANGAKYQAGAIVFNQYIETYIDFQEFTPDTFEAEVNRELRNEVPLRCCTTHAEAAILAKEMFDAAIEQDEIDGIRYENIAFFITDGVPFVNYESGPYGVLGNSRAEQFYLDRELSLTDWLQGDTLDLRDEERVNYATQLVPPQMLFLKNAGVRVFFIGVPHRNPEKNVNIDYFTGRLPETCYTNVDVTPNQTSCGNMIYSPLVSEPVDDHAFSVDEWNIEPLVNRSLDIICKPWSPPGISCTNRTRDVLILVDTSASMDPQRYPNEMMDVVKLAGAELDFTAGSRVGVATFGERHNTNIEIPLQSFSNLRNYNDTIDRRIKNIELKCCTNLGEALRMVREHFEEKRRGGAEQILLIVTDGTPFQNFGAFPWNWQNGRENEVTRCDYITEIVPEQARLLKADGVRVALAGVPNNNLRPPLEDFFTGVLEGDQCCANTDTNKACLINDEEEWCSGKFDPNGPIKCNTYTNASIVSAGNNIFTAYDWNLDTLINGVREMICDPGFYPTIPADTLRPSPHPTRFPIPEFPTDRPTSSPNAGTQRPSSPQAGPPTNRPSLSPTIVTSRPSSPQAGPPTPRPTFPLSQGIDLIFILDTSNPGFTQEARCQANAGKDCQESLVDSARIISSGLIQNAEPNSMRISTIHGNCYLTQPDETWTQTQDGRQNRFNQMESTRMWGEKCNYPSLLAAKKMIEDRQDQNRPIAVVFLSHENEPQDNCLVSSIANDINTGSGVRVYALTVGTSSSSHLNYLEDITDASSRIYTLYSSDIQNIIDDITEDFEV